MNILGECNHMIYKIITCKFDYNTYFSDVVIIKNDILLFQSKANTTYYKIKILPSTDSL